MLWKHSILCLLLCVCMEVWCMGLHVCPPFITLYGYVICNGAVDVRGLMLSNYPVSGSYTFWWCGHTTLVLLNIVPPHITMLEPHCHAWFIVWVCHWTQRWIQGHVLSPSRLSNDVFITFVICIMNVKLTTVCFVPWDGHILTQCSIFCWSHICKREHVYWEILWHEAQLLWTILLHVVVLYPHVILWLNWLYLHLYVGMATVIIVHLFLLQRVACQETVSFSKWQLHYIHVCSCCVRLF